MALPDLPRNILLRDVPVFTPSKGVKQEGMSQAGESLGRNMMGQM